MVVVDYPDNTCRKFFELDNMLFGPIDSNGNYKAVQIDLPLKEERFEPKRGIFGENDIIHSSFHGRIFYYPILADCVPIPDATYPRKIRVPVMETPSYKDTLYGFGCPDCGALIYVFSQRNIQSAVRRDDNGWTVIRLNQVSSTKCYVYEYTFSFKKWNSTTKVDLYYSYRYSTLGINIPFDMSKSRTCQEIFDTRAQVTRWTSYAQTVKTCSVYTTDPSAAISPSHLSNRLETYVDNLMNSDFPIPEVPYGDLAARAVKQKRLIDSNIFEFLRDLPNAKSLIPKLKNLMYLKTHAENYLRLNYGVLPTASDMSEIVAAFQSRLPYLDRFGNTVLNASQTVINVVDKYQYSLKQYIKVAVTNEDSEFLKLLDELDSWGLGLTLENAWDLIRYSFVVDWFINVGGFLERIDNNLRLLRYNIPYVTMSRKKFVYGEIPQSINLLTMGPIEWRYYHRWVDSHCPLPPLTLSTTPTLSSHWLEGGALIIQRAL